MAGLRILLFVLVSCYCASCERTPTLCAYSKSEEFNVADGIKGTILFDNETIQCPGHDEFRCFVAWKKQHKNMIHVLYQGCWQKTTDDDCSQDQCRSGKLKGDKKNKTNDKYFCCCEGDYCNTNMTDYVILPSRSSPTDDNDMSDNPSFETAVLLSVISFTCISILIIIVVLFCRVCFREPEKKGHQSAFIEPPPVEPDFDLDGLKLLELVGQGRYCNVFKAILNSREVAVKIFSMESRECYFNELAIYSVPLLQHDNVLKFKCSGEKILNDNWVEYRLVTELIHFGSLMSYLKEHTYDWHAMCKLAHTAAAGLAHLHLASNKGGESKPAIVHRDINSRNILVKLDGTCCIADFGFAMKVCGANIVRDGNRDNSNITDVGTVRYMAPEVLDGAVNLRDCECALKQVDIYSLGLVLWELATRCKDLYPGTTPPNYKMPFQEEVGLRPSFAEMQVHVCTDRGQPAFPDEWKDNHMALRSLKDTIEECWDHDAEARLTALCVEERIIELMVLWDKHRSLTPTINPTSQVTSVNTDMVPRTAEEFEPFLNMENRLMGNQIITRLGCQEILPYAASDLSKRYDKGSSSGVEKNERQNLLSPGTVSTSLSSPSELSLIDFTCSSQSVDPKNIHHSDDSIERFTTDLKYGPMHKPPSNQEAVLAQEGSSSISEPNLSPDQGHMVVEMPPPLGKHQMTDNLSNEGRRRHRHKGSSVDSGCHLPKSDVNRQRQLAKAAEIKPPSYEQVTANDGSSKNPAHENATYFHEENTSPNMNKRPSTLPLVSDTNTQKKKMMAVYIPDCGPSTRVQTGIAHLENLDQPCQAVRVGNRVKVNHNGIGPFHGQPGRERPASWDYDASVDSTQSMSEDSSRSSRSSSTENINGTAKIEKRRGTPYRIHDDKLTVGKQDDIEARPENKKSNLEVSISNNNVSDNPSVGEGFGLLHNGHVTLPHSSNSSIDRLVEKQEYQVSMV